MAKKKRTTKSLQVPRWERQACRLAQMPSGKNGAQGEPKNRHLGRGHIAALDGIRGLAVLGVMSTHLFTGDMTRLPRLVTLPLSLGVAGVDLFFVLSGFLITGILRDSLGDRFYFRKFYARRALRIFPLYYGILVLLLLLTRPLRIYWHGVQWSLLLYLQNTRFLFPSLLTFGNPFFSVDHLWSLAVEEQFYLVWPLILVSVRSPRRLLGICGAGALVSVGLRLYGLHAGYGFDWINRNTLCRADELLAGAALALVMRSRHAGTGLKMAKPVMLVAIFAGTVAQLTGLWISRKGPSPLGIALLTATSYDINLLAATSLVAWCLRPASRLRSVFEWKHLRSVGKYSYGLYVLHLILLPGMTLLLLRPLRVALHGKLLARLAIGLLTFVVSGLAAVLSFHLYEKRFLRMKRFFDYDELTRSAPKPVTPRDEAAA